MPLLWVLMAPLFALAQDPDENAEPAPAPVQWRRPAPILEPGPAIRDPDLGRGEPRLVVQQGHDGIAWEIALSPGGRLLASAGDDGIRVFDTSTGLLVRHVPTGPRADVVAADEPGIGGLGQKESPRFETKKTVAFSPDGRSIAYLFRDTARERNGEEGELEDAEFLLRLVSLESGATKDIARFASADHVEFWNGQIAVVSRHDPLVLVDPQTGRIEAKTTGPDGVWWAEVSGQTMVAAEGEDLLVWSGKRKARISAPEGLAAYAFAPRSDGGQVAASFVSSIDEFGNGEGGVVLWDVASGKPLWTRKGDACGPIAFDPRGGWIAVLESDFPQVRLRVLDARDGSLAGEAKLPWTDSRSMDIRDYGDVVVSPDGERIHVGMIGGVTTFASSTGKIIGAPDATTMALAEYQDEPPSHWITDEGTHLVVSHLGSTLLFDLTSGTAVAPLEEWGSLAIGTHGRYVVLDEDGRLALFESWSRDPRWVDPKPRNVDPHGSREPPSELAWLPGGRIAVARAGGADLVNGSTGETIARLDQARRPGPVTRRRLSVAPGGQRLAVASVSWTPLHSSSGSTVLSLHDLPSGKRRWERILDGAIDAMASHETALAISYRGALGWHIEVLAAADGNSLGSVGPFLPDGPPRRMTFDGETIRIPDAGSAGLLREAGNDLPFRIEGLADPWPLDVRFEATPDGGLRIRDREARELGILRTFDDGSWVILDRDGRFDASDAGDSPWLHIAIGATPVDLAQLKDRYYEPGLLAKLTGRDRGSLRSVVALDAMKPLPEVRLDGPRGATLSIEITDRGGGIGPVQVFVEGKEFVADARGGRKPRNGKLQIQLDLSKAAALSGAENEIRVVARNADGIASRGGVVPWTPPPSPKRPEPQAWLIVAGVSKYANPSLSLRYASADARQMAETLRSAAAGLVGPDRVHLTLLAGDGTPAASAENLRSAFAAARNAQPEDLLIVFFAGHGISRSGEYLFLTSDARTADPAALGDEGLRRATTISGEELTSLLTAIPALKQVMILDTCAAGAAADKLLARRAIDGDRIRALERLKDRTGFHVLMGSAADAVSYEASRFGQGLLTWSLLQGMKGVALRDGRFVDVSKLFSHAVDTVPELSRGIGGIQRPIVSAPRGQSFEIGALGPEQREAIRLSGARPIVLRPVLGNHRNFDELGLEARLRRALRDAASASDSSREAPIVFVDAAPEDLPGGLNPRGLYSTTVSGEVSVSLALYRGRDEVGTFQERGTMDDVDSLATRLATRIIETARAAEARHPAN